jgi:multiple sugar transport system substrate-binding protein
MEPNKNLLQNFSKQQLIVLGIIIAVVLIFAGIFTGILPGLKQQKATAPQMDLVVWGVGDKEDAFNNNFFAYSKTHSNVKIIYKKINEATYEEDLVNALAAGKGPDIFMFNSSWLPKHIDKVAPMPVGLLSLSDFRLLFPEVVEKDFVWKSGVYAMPLFVDTLALFYNQDIFDNYAIALPPKDWLDFENLIPKLRQIDSSGNIIRAGAAIGGTESTVHNASDILSLLMLQAGTQMVTDNFSQASFVSTSGGGQPGLQSLNFYASFADPKGLYYTWNESMPNSVDAFAQGKTAMVFEYASQKQIIQTKNPFLKIKISFMPQPKAGEQNAVNYASYWGLAVSKYTKYPDSVWDVVSYLTGNEAAAENYLKITNHPPALRSLIQRYADDPNIGVFARQALTAKTWLKPDPEKTKLIFSQLIGAVVSKQLADYDALSQAERAISDLIQQNTLNHQP